MHKLTKDHSMTEFEFYLEMPPFYNIEEILRWIAITQLPELELDWETNLESIKTLEQKLLFGEIRAYGSIDTSPVQVIDQWAWTEFEILQALPNGSAVSKRPAFDINNFIVRSVKAFRPAALRDLSQPSKDWVATLGGTELGNHRVMDQVVFLASEVHRTFPVSNMSDPAEPYLNKYAEAISEIECGKYLESHEPYSQAHISRLIYDLWKVQKRPETTLSTIQRNVSRHYANISRGRH